MLAKLKAIATLLAILGMGALMLTGTLALVDRPSARGDVVQIGSKAFTESIILGEIVAQSLERGGTHVERRFNLGATNIAFAALREGSIDLYPEYTGTGLIAILEHAPIDDPHEVFTTVRSEFEKRYGLTWLEPLGFNNAYALAVPRRLAERLQLTKISDLLRHPELRAGFASEFLARDDGWPGLSRKYGLRFAREPSTMEAGLMYTAASSGQVDVVSAYTTDGRIDTADLVVLDDDRRFFPPYEAALVVRRDALARHPGLEARLSELSGAMTDAEMRKMNADVDSGRKSAADVAREFLALKKP